MKKPISFFIVISIVGFMSCEKDKDISQYRFNNCSSNCIEIIGRVIDASNENEIKGASIRLEYKTQGGLINQETTIGQVQTDNSGIYNVSFHADSTDFSHENFRIYLNKEGYLEKYLFLSERKIVHDSCFDPYKTRVIF